MHRVLFNGNYNLERDYDYEIVSNAKVRNRVSCS